MKTTPLILLAGLAAGLGLSGCTAREMPEACRAVLELPPPPLFAMHYQAETDALGGSHWTISKPNAGTLPLVLDVSGDTSGHASAPLLYIAPGASEVAFSGRSGNAGDPVSVAIPRVTFVHATPAEGKVRAPVQLRFPVDGRIARISQSPRDGAGFLRARSHTAGRGGQFEAIDIDAPVGTPMVSPVDGVVADAFDDSPDIPCDFLSHVGRGNFVAVVTDDDVTVILSHIKRDSVVVTAGTRVRRGDPIAEVGHSGSGDRAHIHLVAMALGPDGVDSIPVRFDACGTAADGWEPRNGVPCR